MGQLRLYNERMAERYEDQRAAVSPKSADDGAYVSYRAAHAEAASRGEVEVIYGH